MPLKAGDTPMAGFDSTPAIAIPDAVKVRGTELAGALQNAMTQGHVEANIVNQLLGFVQELIPFIKPMITKG